MTIPIWSIVTLATELGVSAVVFYVIWRAVTKIEFHRPLAFGVLAYEVLFNISSMAARSFEHISGKSSVVEKPGEVVLAAFHGILSLIMFVALIIFFMAAAKRYARGENFFLHHHTLTTVFLYAWGASVLSGTFLFFRLYL